MTGHDDDMVPAPVPPPMVHQDDEPSRHRLATELPGEVEVVFTVTFLRGKTEPADVIHKLETELGIVLLKLRAFEHVTSWDVVTSGPGPIAAHGSPDGMTQSVGARSTGATW